MTSFIDRFIDNFIFQGLGVGFGLVVSQFLWDRFAKKHVDKSPEELFAIARKAFEEASKK